LQREQTLPPGFPGEVHQEANHVPGRLRAVGHRDADQFQDASHLVGLEVDERRCDGAAHRDQHRTQLEERPDGSAGIYDGDEHHCDAGDDTADDAVIHGLPLRLLLVPAHWGQRPMRRWKATARSTTSSTDSRTTYL